MKLKQSLISLLVAMTVNSAWAANGILINEYVKAGVNETTGTFGSGGNTPPGLQYDSTGTGTFNNSYDYLTPGSPFDGFTVKITQSDGTTLIHQYLNNNAGNSHGVTGGWVTTPTSSVAVWEGTGTEFTLRNSYSLPAGQQYIDIDTKIVATSIIPVLYFGRYIDPDARAAAGDSSSTDNALGYGAIPVKNVAFSEALSSRYALGLYTSQTTGDYGAGISPGWSTDPNAYLNNTNGVNVVRGDYTIGLGFKVSGLAVGDIVHFNYAYIFGPSAFGAATTAVTSGAGGGTPGTTPGGGTLTDVGSATDAASTPSAPTVVSVVSTKFYTTSWSSWVTDTSLPIIVGSIAHHDASEAGGVQTIARETTTTTTTPQIRSRDYEMKPVTTYSDSTTSTGTATSTGTDSQLQNDVGVVVTNDSFSGRIDQYDVLEQINTGINRSLNSDAFRKDLVATGKGRAWLSYNYLNSDTSNSYSATSNQVGFGYERDIKDNLVLGFQYNRVVTNLHGADSSTHQSKNHWGAYTIWTKNDWIVKSDLAFADNNMNSSRNVENLFTNSSKTLGTDWWISNRVYTPELKGFRPYAGVTLGRDQRDGYTELGSIQSARTVASVTDNTNYAEAGVRYEKKFSKLGLIGDASFTTDSYQTYKVGARYDVGTKGQVSVALSRKEHNSLSTDVVGITGKIDF